MGLKQNDNYDHSEYLKYCKSVIDKIIKVNKKSIILLDWDEAATFLPELHYIGNIGLNVNKNSIENAQSHRQRTIEYMKAGIPILNTFGDPASYTLLANAMYLAQPENIESYINQLEIIEFKNDVYKSKKKAILDYRAEFIAENVYGRLLDSLQILPILDFDRNEHINKIRHHKDFQWFGNRHDEVIKYILNNAVDSSTELNSNSVSNKKTNALVEIALITQNKSHDEGDHQHLNYSFENIKLLEKSAKHLHIRIVSHLGKPGIAIFGNPNIKKIFPSWTCHGNENGIEFMLIIPSDKIGRDWLMRISSSEILLLNEIVNRVSDEMLLLRNKKWSYICYVLLNQLQNLNQELKYDDIIILSANTNKLSIEIVNPSHNCRLLSFKYVEITNKHILSVSDGLHNIQFNSRKVNSSDAIIKKLFNRQAGSIIKTAQSILINNNLTKQTI
jgi:hypothetical protein